MRIELKTPWQRKQFLFFALLRSCGRPRQPDPQPWGAVCPKGPPGELSRCTTDAPPWLISDKELTTENQCFDVFQITIIKSQHKSFYKNTERGKVNRLLIERWSSLENLKCLLVIWDVCHNPKAVAFIISIKRKQRPSLKLALRLAFETAVFVYSFYNYISN